MWIRRRKNFLNNYDLMRYNRAQSLQTGSIDAQLILTEEDLW